MTTIGFPAITIALFVVVTTFLLWLDLYAHKSHKAIPLKDAALWSSFYIVAAIVFAAYLGQFHGTEAASLFLTGYTLEKVLAVDNLIVFAAIFAYFKIPDEYQHRILHWGIIGAVVFRLIFVAIGTGSLMLFGPVVELVFAFIVAWTALALWNSLGNDEDDDVDYGDLAPVRWAKKIWLVAPEMDGRFFVPVVMNTGIYRAVTPAFLCLIAIEISDILFAFDSVPAVIAVTQDPFLVYSAMIFAILGLRSLYFVMSALMRYLVHLEKAVVAVLFFIAAKLALHSITWFGVSWGLLPLEEALKIPANISLIIVLSTLSAGVIASFIFSE